MKKLLVFALSSIAAVWLTAGAAFGLSLNLVAEEATVTMPDATVMTMWGLRDTADAAHAAGDWKVPVFSTDETDSLSITLTNNLPDDSTSTLAKPTSLIIPGLRASEFGAMAPTWTDGTTGNRGADLTKRVRSLTHEAANGGGSATYDWAALKPGTYLIQSGSHQAVQVQMGLYAVLIVYPSTPGIAYNPSVTVSAAQVGFTTEQTLVFSEIDTAVHTAVAADDYGAGKTYTSTMNYHPDYFLINGQPYAAGSSPLNIGTANDDVLIRLVNTGYETRIPVFKGEYFNLIAEDGNLLPYVREQYSVELTAGKTKDIIINQPQQTQIAVYDGTLALNNGGTSGGGMLAFLASTAQGDVISPNGGETLYAGDLANITWAENPAATNYAIRASYNSGASWFTVATGVTGGSYSWTVPNVGVTTARVRVVAYNGTTWLGADDSDADFTIVKGGLVVSPNGTESFNGNSLQTIQWTAHPDAATYDIRLSYNSGASFFTIATGVTGTTFGWTVPNVDLTTARVRVVSRNGGGTWLASDDSDADFTIVKGGLVVSPNGTESFNGNSLQAIQWTATTGATNYAIRLSYDSGVSFFTIATGVTGTTYDWTVPNVNVGTARVKVVSYNGTTWLGADDSDADFTIVQQ